MAEGDLSPAPLFRCTYRRPFTVYSQRRRALRHCTSHRTDPGYLAAYGTYGTCPVWSYHPNRRETGKHAHTKHHSNTRSSVPVQPSCTCTTHIPIPTPQFPAFFLLPLSSYSLFIFASAVVHVRPCFVHPSRMSANFPAGAGLTLRRFVSLRLWPCLQVGESACRREWAGCVGHHVCSPRRTRHAMVAQTRVVTCQVDFGIRYFVRLRFTRQHVGSLNIHNDSYYWAPVNRGRDAIYNAWGAYIPTSSRYLDARHREAGPRRSTVYFYRHDK